MKAIVAEGLGKQYVIGHQTKHDTLRDALTSSIKSLIGGWRGKLNPNCETFWALKDVSFDINRGEVVGIIGRNGAGKSTLLKLLSRITEPTEGRITLQGRVASLLEVGTGFHPELTGRENIFLNGAILGMSNIEIRRKFEEIVAFAEVERFLDTPVKRYSSGMYVRLAFAVAAHLEPEILIVDEVLAVGDSQFQSKCLGKMQEVASGQGRTVLFVSHNMAAVSSLCHRAILLESGRVAAIGPTREILQRYAGTRERSTADVEILPSHHYAPLGGHENIQLTKVRLRNSYDGSFAVRWKDGLDIELSFTVHRRCERIAMALSVADVNEVDLFGWHHDDDGSPPFDLDPGQYRMCLSVQNPLRAGAYYLSFGASAVNGSSNVYHVSRAVRFEVMPLPVDGQRYPTYEAGPFNGSATWTRPVPLTSP